MKLLPRVLVFAVVLGASVGCDQVTKVIAIDSLKGAPARHYLGDTFRLQYATNEGAFLSLGASLPTGARYWVLTVAVGLLLAGISVYALASKKHDGWQVAGYGLIAGGGFSNWVDRARNEGSVVDFMNMGLGPSLRTGIFNVADLAILAGIGVLLVVGQRLEKRAKLAAAAATQGAHRAAVDAAKPPQG
ncbi:MAG: signal peptidase II [Archangiaceae bacterium]|nr:signal peptidase II [Archangiaceae bacterium]